MIIAPKAKKHNRISDRAVITTAGLLPVLLNSAPVVTLINKGGELIQGCKKIRGMQKPLLCRTVIYYEPVKDHSRPRKEWPSAGTNSTGPHVH